jgi:hypothetical protein
LPEALCADAEALCADAQALRTPPQALGIDYQTLRIEREALRTSPEAGGTTSPPAPVIPRTYKKSAWNRKKMSPSAANFPISVPGMG